MRVKPLKTPAEYLKSADPLLGGVIEKVTLKPLRLHKNYLMFLMFTMGRPDVFSYGDLGLQKAIIRLYNLRKPPTPKRAEKISNPWRPHRTLASRYLWASLELS
ncbi:MAG: hypothetical protein HY001_00840 [Candidatus Portnoybacteria bacterium]|nr:hypothetical protein [Candidatus Portnoybacteria bacterium]